MSAAASTMAGTEASANVARFLALRASERPEAPAVVAPRGAGFETWTWRELDQRASRVAHGLHARGLRPGERACVFVRPGLDWLALVHGLFKLGAVPVLIDPGMGREGVLASIRRVAPRALIGVWQVHLARRLSQAAFRSVELALTAGVPRLGALADGSLEALLSGPDVEYDAVSREPRDVAAILFTSGSTGPAKGVVYEHGMFEAQVAMLRELYEFAPGQRDLACFPLFALFGPALGLESVFPRMDFTAPARCDPAEIVRAVVNFGATSSFGSPAIWRRVVPWCEAQGLRLETLATLMIAGAPVEADLVRRARAVIAPGGRVFTPYGATECLPVAQVSGDLLSTTLAERAAGGEGTCVGSAAPGVEIRLVRIVDEPLPRWDESLAVPAGEAGEICVRGPNVTREYAFDAPATAAAKIADGAGFWHRIGDLGRFDRDGRLWFLGRKAHRLETAAGLLFPVPVENAFRARAALGRCALVGAGPRGRELPVLIVECPAGVPRARGARDVREREILAAASGLAVCAPVARVLFKRHFPVDLRHQAKIDRTALKHWAAGELA